MKHQSLGLVWFSLSFGLVAAATAWAVSVNLPARYTHAFSLWVTLPAAEAPATLEAAYFAAQLTGEVARRAMEFLRSPVTVAEIYATARVRPIEPRPFAYESGWSTELVGAGVVVRALSPDARAGPALARATAAVLGERVSPETAVQFTASPVTSTAAPRRTLRNVISGFAAGVLVAVGIRFWQEHAARS
ncbi:hypothetical protein HY442_01840 [Candidatus Parcubacteria bacterium]|nr:hypothetical protein [Candidatus Parcubacteria bacterium]MBI4385600.1 hypothetical protein [Candidatus Parcubacteria bacterium]